MPRFIVEYRDPNRTMDDVGSDTVELIPGWAIFNHANGERLIIPADIIDSIDQHN